MRARLVRRDLHMFEDASFDAVLEKGTMDAMMSSDTGAADVNRMLSEVDRSAAPPCPHPPTVCSKITPYILKKCCFMS